MPLDARFSIREAFRRARETYFRHPFLLSGCFFGMFLVWALLEVLVIYGSPIFGSVYNLTMHLGYFWVASIPEAALVAMALQLDKGEAPHYRKIAKDRQLITIFTLEKILFLLITLTGTAALLIPGLFLMVRFQLSEYYLVDKRCGVIEAMRWSYRATHGAGWTIFRFQLLLTLLHLLGASILGLGLLVTIPISALASAHLYRHLSDTSGAEQRD